jgi:ribonuclease D
MPQLAFSHRLTKQEIKQLAPYPGLDLDVIKIIHHESDIDAFAQRILNSDVVGFDTETKPTFQAGATTNQVNIVQVASEHGALLLRVDDGNLSGIVSRLIGSQKILKVGFGLHQDKKQLFRLFGERLENSVDLSTAFSQFDIKQRVGAQAAVALVLGLHLRKSKKVQLSNWASKELTKNQILYAANDAYCAFDVYKKLLTITQEI